MRRAAGLALVIAALQVRPGRAAAGPWTVTGEAGAEIDTNVQRVEGVGTNPIVSPVLRLGARADGKNAALGGTYTVHLADLTRVAGDRSVSLEDVALLSADARYLHPIGERSVAAGLGVTAVDAFPLDDKYGARTFRNLGADLLVAAHAGEDHRLSLGFGWRDFIYKPPTDPAPPHLFDWSGPVASARLDLVLWQPAGHTRSLELVTTLGFEARTYEARAFVNACPPNAVPDPMCSASTDLARRDRASRAGVELTWVGRQVASLGYQLTVIDSNSFGQSFARHRVLASGTMSIGESYLSLLAILQVDQYLDGLLVQRDLTHSEFTNIEDENRSSAQLHFARKVSGDWTVEGRVAYWRNILGGTMDLSFQRALFYGGVVYTK